MDFQDCDFQVGDTVALLYAHEDQLTGAWGTICHVSLAAFPEPGCRYVVKIGFPCANSRVMAVKHLRLVERPQ